MLKAVIFDLDGLMVDSTPIQTEAFRLLVESFGKIYLPSNGQDSGMRIIDIVRDMKDIFGLPGTVEELYRKRQEYFYDLARRELVLFPGVLPLLQKLKQRELSCAMATSGDKSYVEIVFTKFPDIRPFFDVVVTSEDVVRGKPYPDVYQQTVQKLQLAPQECIVLEDSVNGIASAKAAGIQVICIPNKNFPDADYSMADKVFDSLDQVAEAIP